MGTPLCGGAGAVTIIGLVAIVGAGAITGCGGGVMGGTIPS
jgi:hypothetical protein